MEQVRLLHGDCLALLPGVESGSVDAIVSDPPWGMGCNTDSTRFTGGNCPALRLGEGRDDWPTVAGDDRPFDPTPWLKFPRVILWGSNHFAHLLPVGTTLVWIKKADHLFGTFLSDCELAWMKGGHGVYAFRKQFPASTRAREGAGECAHPMQKPVALLKWCIGRLKLPPGATICDPYMGSGTTGVAAVQLGFNFLGMEIDAHYFQVASRRIEAAQSEGPLFAPRQASLLGEGP